MPRRIRSSKIRKKYNKSKMRRKRYTKKYRKVGGSPPPPPPIYPDIGADFFFNDENNKLIEENSALKETINVLSINAATRETKYQELYQEYLVLNAENTRLKEIEALWKQGREENRANL